MKLSEKGIEKVENYSSVDLEIEGFEPDDFEDVVVLTVEEAKEFLIAFQDLIDLHEDGYIKITDFGFDTFDLVKKRIEQAEKQK